MTESENIFEAIEKNDLDRIKMLIEQDIKIVKGDGTYRIKPLNYACLKNCSPSIIRLLLEKGAEVNAQDENCETPLRYATKIKNNLETVSILVDHGADVNDRNTHKPIFNAVEIEENFATVEYLFNHGVDIFTERKDSELLLNACQVKNNVETIEFLLKKDCKVNDIFGYFGTPLHAATNVAKNTQVLELLLKYGGSLQLLDKYGWTPLERAVQISNNVENVEFLFKKSAEEKLTFDMFYLFGNACRVKDNVEILNFLLKHGVNLNEQGHFIFGGTFLFQASLLEGNIKNMKLLLDHGANIEAVGNFGRTCLHFLCSIGEYPLNLTFLIENGANINVQNRNGLSPLMETLSKGHFSNIRVLMNNGADAYSETSIIQSVYDNRTKSPSHKKTLIYFLKYLIKLRVLNLLENKVNSAWMIPMNTMPVYKIICEDEANRMRQQLIWPKGSLTLAGILTRKKESIAVYCNSQEFEQQVEQCDLNRSFSNYSEMIRDKIEIAKKLVELVNYGYTSLQKIFMNIQIKQKIRIPHITLTQIFNLLDEEDIRKINKIAKSLTVCENFPLFSLQNNSDNIDNLEEN